MTPDPFQNAPQNTPRTALQAAIHRDFAAAQAGSTLAYERLVVATQRMVASVALSVTRDIAASEDIAQDTFLRAWQHLGSMGNPDSFLPWLRHVARNRAIDHLRSLRHRHTANHEDFETLADPGVGPEQSLDRAQQAALITEAMDEIPEDSREVLLLFYREGQSSQAVAALLGLSDGAVRKRLQRARESLREGLLQRLGEVARSSTPGVAFTTMVATALVLGPKTAAASGIAATTGALVKASPKMLLATLGALAASLALVVGGVVWEMRGHLRKTRDANKRRALIANGVVYASLMGGYIVGLGWMSRQGWSNARIMGIAVITSVLVIALAVHRTQVLRRRPFGEHDDL